MILGIHRPPDALHAAAEAVVRVGEHVHLRLHPGRDVGELGLAIVRQDVPRAGIHQREHRDRARCHERADRRVQVDDEPVELGAHVAEVEVELCLATRRKRRVPLRAQCLEIADVLLGLVLLPPRLVEPGRGGELRGTGLIELVRGHELPGQQRLEPVQRVGGVLELRLHALHGRRGRGHGEALPLDAALGHADLTIERGDVGPCALDRELVWARVDDEHQVSLLHALIVLDVQLGDRAAHLRDDADDVGRHDGIVRLRVSHETADDHDTENDRARDDADADDPSEPTSLLAHPSFRTVGATWRRSRDRRGMDRSRPRGRDAARPPSRRTPAA